MGVEKPRNYENTQAQGEFTPIELGGHKLVIKQVEEYKSNAGKPMLKVSFDTADDDKQPHYFADQFRADIRPDKKWPHNGVTYVMREDENGNCSRAFKTFTTCAEKSNPGFTIAWGDAFCQCFKNKHIGGVFGVQMDSYNGKDMKKHVLRWFRTVDKALEADIPEPTQTQAYKNNQAIKNNGDTGFMDIPTGLEEELPFN